MSGPYDACRMNAVAWFDSLPAPDRWRELALVHGPRIATWILALLLGVQAALLVTDFAGGTASPVVGKPAASRPQQRLNVSAIANAHLFGQRDAVANVDAANAPQTSMQLVLTGIIAGDDPNSGLAIVGESASSAKVYGMGDVLPGGAKLHAVYSDRVLLDRNGSIESLPLPRQMATGGAQPMSSLPGPSPDSPAPVDRVRQLIADQPGAVSEIMRPTPVFAQGKQRGYRVYPGRNRQAFVRLGLRPGDLVTSINGTPLDDPSRGPEIFQTLSSATEARVTVVRGGRQQDLSLNMAQVAQQAEQVANESNPDAGEAQLQVPDEPADPDDGDSDE